MNNKVLLAQGRKAINLIVDSDSFQENTIDVYGFDPEIGPCAVIGSATINKEKITLIANDARVINPRFKVVYAGLIGLEEAYKMAMAVHWTIECDSDKSSEQKRPIVLIVDTPGNAAGKKEEIIGIHKATGEYQLALARARKMGHPVVAVVIGRAISGGFLCHGLQGDRIVALSKKFGTMVHVMPLTSIARITKIDIAKLQAMANENPVFAAGVDFFYRLGGVDEIIEDLNKLREVVIKNIDEVRRIKKSNQEDKLGPWGRGLLGRERGGRQTRQLVMDKMFEEFESIVAKYI